MPIPCMLLCMEISLNDDFEVHVNKEPMINKQGSHPLEEIKYLMMLKRKVSKNHR